MKDLIVHAPLQTGIGGRPAAVLDKATSHVERSFADRNGSLIAIARRTAPPCAQTACSS